MIRVLGEVRICGERLDDPGVPLRVDRKGRELITVLALHAPAALGLEELGRLLWDEPPTSAARTLRAHISRIRAAAQGAGVPAVIVSAHGESYRLASGVHTDLAQARRLRREARQLAAGGSHDEAARLLSTAREWWAALPQLPTTLAGSAMRTGWEQERRELVADHLDAVIHGSRPSDALAELSALTAAQPFDEPAWVQYVTALHAAGRQVEALEAVARARSALAEVGLDPGSALQAAQAAVLSDPAENLDPSPAQRRSDPEIRYTQRGVTAYAVLSHGATDLLLLNPAMITLDGLAEQASVREACNRLGSLGRLLTLDRRGIGLSAPLEPGVDPLEQWVDDVESVLTSADAHDCILVANFDTGLVALEFAARHPDRLLGLVLVNCYARYRKAPDYPHGLDHEQTSHLIESAVDPTQARPLDTAALVAPTLTAADPTFREWWNRIGRRGASPGTARIIREVGTSTDLRARLDAVRCPTLVLHRRECINIDPGHSRYLSAHLPHAQSIALDGTDGVWFTDSAALTEVMASFIRAQRSPPRS